MADDRSTRVAAIRHELPFDPTYGYDLDALLAISAPEAPDDFDAFWRDCHQRARAVDVAPEVGPPLREADGFRVHEVTYTSLDGFRVGGWLTVPADGVVTRGCVFLHGYGGREQPETAYPAPGTATIWPCGRGLGARSLSADVPAVASEHVLHGIASRETYVHRGCVADVWCAASALLALVPEAGRRLHCIGGSFGGGIGALALPWDDRFHGGALTVPSFGHHPLRLTMQCVGSGESVRRYHARHPAVTDVLPYFDAAVAATRIQVPVHVGAALFDPAVPPPGQFAVYNALPGRKQLFVLSAGHFTHSDEAAEQAQLRDDQLTFLG